MRFILFALAVLTCAGPAFALTGQAPPASGAYARAIVMLVDDQDDLCTATALSRDVVLTAAHCVIGARNRSVKIYQTGATIRVRAAIAHPQFNAKAYAAARATADLALVKLEQPLPDIVAPAALAPARRVAVGETLTVAGFGVTKAYTPYGLGIPREAKLDVTGRPGSLQIRLVDPATRNLREGLGACTGDSGAPAFDADGRLVAVVSWSTAPNDQDGCGGLTGLTPLLMYRGWIVKIRRTLLIQPQRLAPRRAQGIPREPKLAVTSQPGSLQIRLVHTTPQNRREGMMASVSNPTPAFEAHGHRRRGELVHALENKFVP